MKEHPEAKSAKGPSGGSATDVIKAPKPELRIVRYELSDFEWTAIKPMPPNKTRDVRRVNERRVFNGIFSVLRSGDSGPIRDLLKRPKAAPFCESRSLFSHPQPKERARDDDAKPTASQFLQSINHRPVTIGRQQLSELEHNGATQDDRQHKK
jgi:hypothetical protein